MEINVKYDLETNGVKNQYYIILTILNERGTEHSFVYNNNESWIKVSDLLDSSYLLNNNIKYYLDDTQNIIPYGIVDFNNKSGKSTLAIVVDETSEISDAQKLIENIIEAIKISYAKYKSANDFIDKCRKESLEKFSIEEY